MNTMDSHSGLTDAEVCLLREKYSDPTQVVSIIEAAPTSIGQRTACVQRCLADGEVQHDLWIQHFRDYWDHLSTMTARGLIQPGLTDEEVCYLREQYTGQEVLSMTATAPTWIGQRTACVERRLSDGEVQRENWVKQLPGCWDRVSTETSRGLHQHKLY